MMFTSCPFQTAGRQHLSFAEIIFPSATMFSPLLPLNEKNVRETFEASGTKQCKLYSMRCTQGSEIHINIYIYNQNECKSVTVFHGILCIQCTQSSPE